MAVRVTFVGSILLLVGCTPDVLVGAGGAGATSDASMSAASTGSSPPTTSSATGVASTSGATTSVGSSTSTSASTGSVTPVTVLEKCGNASENFDAGLANWSISGTSSYTQGHVELEASESGPASLTFGTTVPTVDCYLTMRISAVALPGGTHLARLRAVGMATAYASTDGVGAQKHGIDGSATLAGTSTSPPIVGLGLAFANGSVHYFYEDASGKWVAAGSTAATIGAATVRFEVDGTPGTRFAFDDFNVEAIDPMLLGP